MGVELGLFFVSPLFHNFDSGLEVLNFFQFRMSLMFLNVSGPSW